MLIFHFRCSAFFKIFPIFARFEFEETKSICHLRVKPNDNNLILIPDLNSQDDASDIENNLRPLRCITHLACLDRCARMEPKIVKLAFQALNRAAEEQRDNDEKEQFNKRISKMETILEDISQKLDNVLKQ